MEFFFQLNFTLRFVATDDVGIRSWWLDLDNGIPFDDDDDVPICIDWVIATFFGLASRWIVSLKCCRFVFGIRRRDSPFVNVIELMTSSRARRINNIFF